MRRIFILIFLLTLSFTVFSQKQVYIPSFITSKGMNLNSQSSQWCYARSRESENVVVFWEPGFGGDPSNASGSYRVNLTNLLQAAEKAYSMYLDTLKFALKGSSVTDKYKLMIFLLYSAEWAAYGAGEDNKVGTLHVNPAAANIPSVVAHEIGHCFEYITGCDGPGGYRYGFGPNGSGGNGFWEQCAQWMAFKVYPAEQFTNSDFRNYINNCNLHLLHENLRYAGYFIPDYWTFKHDITFTGKLWRDSRSPEDPVETYKRLNSLSQEQFNDEIFEHAVRLTTWDLPAIKNYGEKYIDGRPQPKMNRTADNFWAIDKSVCIENYGYNCIKLNPPSQATEVSVIFKGNAGAGGYRAINVSKGGWRFGFVALLKDNTRHYSKMGSANVSGNNTNPTETLTFNCPAGCSKLWFVVSGAPQEHWKHPWDDNNSNDEQWPYMVQFRNTNLLGEATETVVSLPTFFIKEKQIPFIRQNCIILPETERWSITNVAGKQILAGYGIAIDISGLPSGSYILKSGKQPIRFLKG